ncbi:MAG: sugar porter family MFS transporter [Pseudomonadota bacterium]
MGRRSREPERVGRNQVTTGEENTPLIISISIVATIGGLLFGFDSGVINGTVEGLQTAFNSYSVGTGFNVASMLLGCAVGAFFAARLADVFGRRSLLLVAAVFFFVSAWGSGAAASSTEFVFYRILGGLAVGAASVLAPAYISEIAPARFRGALTSIQQIAIITGLFTAFLSNYILARSAGSSLSEFWFGFDAWRWMFWVEMAPAAIFFLALMFIPESPRFLVIKGRPEQALKVITRLFGVGAAADKLREIEESLAQDRHRPRLSDLVIPGTRRIRRLIWVGLGLATFQQLVGINVVFYYGAVLWQSVGFTERDALMINVVSGAVSILACAITIVIIDRVGRKPILWAGSIGMAIALAAMAAAFSTASVDADNQVQLSQNAGRLALVSANLYVFIFNMSWGPVMWVMLGEMFPNQLRGSGLAVSGAAQWLSNFAITMTFPILLVSVGLAGAYSIYAVCAVLSVLFVARMVHETRGVELEAMRG